MAAYTLHFYANLCLSLECYLSAKNVVIKVSFLETRQEVSAAK